MIIKNQRILWHEIGHLIIDSLITEDFKEHEITEFSVAEKVNSKVKTIGYSNEDVLRNKKLLSLTIVNLSFGVILEAVFLKKFNDSDENQKPDDLLKFKQTGAHDLAKIREIKSNLRECKLFNTIKEQSEFIYVYLLDETVIFNELYNLKEEIENRTTLIDEINKTYSLDLEGINYFVDKIKGNSNLFPLFQEVKNYSKLIENSIEKVFYED
jgi:hypothetical protein